MKKKLWAGLATGLVVMGMTGMAEATLITIGQATYTTNNISNDYNLIWDNDNNGNSVVWLDYSNTANTWANQVSWAAGLNSVGVLSYTMAAGYTVDFGANAWRLPTTVDGEKVAGFSGLTTAGTNITNSEMGHLFYTELGNNGFQDKNGDTPPVYGLTNKGDFTYLTSAAYWSGTENATTTEADAWFLNMGNGNQSVAAQETLNQKYGLAVWSGQVTDTNPPAQTPIPGAVWLLGSGLVGLIQARRNKKA